MHMKIDLAVAAIVIAAPCHAQDGSTTTTRSSAAAPQSSSFTVTGVFSDGTTTSRIFNVSDRDSDGDGLEDSGLLRVTCSNGAVVDAAYKHDVKSPRDAASGLATGKRMHKPMTITKEIDKATPMMGRTVGYDLKTSTKARMADGNVMGVDDWQAITLTGDNGPLCT